MTTMDDRIWLTVDHCSLHEFSPFITNCCLIIECTTQHDQSVNYLIIGQTDFDPIGN